jgi:hypothetical protein
MTKPKANLRQTPLTKLLADKEDLRKQCLLREQKLNNAFSYMQENAGSLLLSGVSYLIFPGAKTAQRTNTSTPETDTSRKPAALSGLSDWLSVGKMLIPVAWEIVQPFIISWGIRKIMDRMSHLFVKKKKGTANL